MSAGAASRNSRRSSIDVSRRSMIASSTRHSTSPSAAQFLVGSSSPRGKKKKNKKCIDTTEIIHDSEYGSPVLSQRPTLGRKDIERSFLLLEETRRQRKFEAKVIFKEYCLYHDKERMNVNQLKPYMARVFNTKETSFEEEAVKLVLFEAKKKSIGEDEGILCKSGVVSAVIKYGEYLRHCKAIETLFKASDWSNDGKLQREELRKLIENYEETQTRSTELVKNVLLFVTEQDLNFILETADENKDGDIDPTEVMRAVGAWEELAAIKLHDFDKMNYKCCHKGCIIS